jgi:septum formation protein
MLYLASASPRRAELLKQVGLEFRVLPSRVEERRRPREAAAAYVKRLARDKAADVLERLCRRGLRSGRVLGADTVVVLAGRVLEKPRDAAEARAMLARLSGHRHQVLTGVSLIDVGTRRTQSVVELTEVEFRRLAPVEIAAYVATGEPLDKAGAYGIQGAAAAFVRRIEGCYFNVVGLPLARHEEADKKRRAREGPSFFWKRGTTCWRGCPSGP